MMAALGALDIDYEHKAFSCPTCSTLPAHDLVLVFDGKAMGMQKMVAGDWDPPYGPLEGASM